MLLFFSISYFQFFYISCYRDPRIQRFHFLTLPILTPRFDRNHFGSGELGEWVLSNSKLIFWRRFDPGWLPFFIFFGRCSNKAKCCAFFEHFSVYKGILSIFNGRVWFYWNCQWDMCCGWLVIWAVALWICGCLKLWFTLIDGILLLWRKAIDVWVVVMCISAHHLPRVVVYSCRRDSSLKKGDRHMSCSDWCTSPHFSSGCKFNGRMRFFHYKC